MYFRLFSDQIYSLKILLAMPNNPKPGEMPDAPKEVPDPGKIPEITPVVPPEAATTAVNYKTIKVKSTAFEENGLIPSKYTCEGENINPPLDLEQIPAEAKSLVLIVDDPDAPKKTWVHWIVWNIPVTHHIKENDVHGTEGINDRRQHQYSGPCPPSGTHRCVKQFTGSAGVCRQGTVGKSDE